MTSLEQAKAPLDELLPLGGHANSKEHRLAVIQKHMETFAREERRENIELAQSLGDRLAEIFRLKDEIFKLKEANRELLKDKERLETLLNLTNQESDVTGIFQVSLRYDNYQDGALVINGSGKIVAECYDIALSPNEQFRQALDKAALAKGEP